MERDNARKEAEELRRKLAEAFRHMPQFFSEFLFSEIEEATQGFDESLKIGQGGYGSIYKGLLRQTEVAIKRLQSQGSQGPLEFQMEVRVLSQLRHPNLVKLIGSCPETFALIYEYLPNEGLEDRLNRVDNSPPLSWKTRIRIATELCSVLVYLHSNKPHIVHGDLKPSNILLDLNFVSKLSDFGICRMLFKDRNSTNNTTVSCITVPKGTFGYIDLEFVHTGELTIKSDVYSFGIILLQLLTNKPAFFIANEVKHALKAGNFKDLLDPLAGDWPIELAQELAGLALWCSHKNRKSRPDLRSDIWKPPPTTPSHPQPPRAGLSSHNPPTSSRSGDLTVADLEIASPAANDHRKELTTPGKGRSLAPSPIWCQAPGDLSHRRRSGIKLISGDLSRRRADLSAAELDPRR
uniref:RING-type E3 ubiquitin transferase n=1 Tax=Fagus sylvatica TaxID=28930 RepID=A0A2N9GHP0_FAGSY